MAADHASNCRATGSADGTSALTARVITYAYVLACIATLLSCIYNSIRMARSIRVPTSGPPGGRDRELFYNLVNNVMFSPADLTPRGLRYRANALLALFSFLGLLWLGVILMAWL
jgi:hypothetical protein